jgi:uncharacterized membrane protein
LSEALVNWGIRKRTPAGIFGAIAGADLIYRGATGRCAMYRALGVNTAGRKKSGSQIGFGAPEVQRSITIGKSPEELYEFWRNPGNLARINAHFAEVTPGAEGVTHWRVRGPLKQVLEWDSVYTIEQPGRKLAWESLPGSTLVNRGDVLFRPAPDGKGTEVTVQMQFEPPLGGLGAKLVRTFKLVPRSIAGKALCRFKSLVETGEVPTLERNPSGRGASDRI